MSKERLHNVDFIRALCAIGIVFFHYSCGGIHCDYTFLLDWAGGSYGHLFVTIFFIISGGVLYLNHPQIENIMSFYRKRARSIYPAFWLAYAFLFLKQVHSSGIFFYRTDVAPWTLILTFFGVDGYFLYAIPNYYRIGEWFLGGVIMLYLLYPILLNGLNRRPLRSSAVVLGLYLWVDFFNCFTIDRFRNLFSCMLSFWMGMLLMKYRNIWDRAVVGILCLIVAIIALWTSIPFLTDLDRFHLEGLLLFVGLFWLGKWVMRPRILQIAFGWLAKISYCIFLVHHVVIYSVLSRRSPSNVSEYWLILFLTTGITIVLAAGLEWGSKVAVRLWDKEVREITGTEETKNHA